MLCRDVWLYQTSFDILENFKLMLQEIHFSQAQDSQLVLVIYLSFVGLIHVV